MNNINNPKEIYIFGTGDVSEIIADYALNKNIKIISFIDIEPNKKNILNIPTEKYSDNLNKEIPIFVAIGYKELNKNRSKKIDFLKERGWKFANIISSNISNELLGGNIFIANNVSIQPYAQICSGNFIWDNCVIGHHSRINENNWITSGSVIGGYSTLGRNCFLGINTSISHMISVGDFSFIGASTLISKDIKNNSVVIKKSDKVSPFDSDYFTRSGILK
tara:strand:- start:97 stop:759 length:663 start_codon:yes stop_codon:yes gene_type:complete